MPLKFNISVKMILVMSLVLAVSFFILISVAKQQVQQELIDKERISNEVISGYLAQEIAAALRFRKSEKILESFQTLADQKDALLYVVAYGPDLKVVAELGEAKEQQADNLDLLKRSEDRLDKGIMAIENDEQAFNFALPIMNARDGSRLGTLGVVWSMALIHERVDAVLGKLLIVIVPVFLVTIGLLMLAVRFLVSRPIQKIAALGRELAQGDGDLRQRINYGGQDELRGLCDSFNSFIDKVHGIITDVTEKSNSLTSIADQTLKTAEQANQAIQNQRVRLEQMATASTEMSVSIRSVADNAVAANESSSNAKRVSSQGQAIIQQNLVSIGELASEVDRATEAIAKVSADSQQIGTIVEVIRGIADQTNLLALNAAIEAARAGEQGRGFAVVADEVRALAGKTQQSTEEIKNMIERLQEGSQIASGVMEQGRVKAQEGVEQASKTRDALSQITAAVETISQVNSQIVDATGSQTETAEEISSDILEVNQLCSQSADSASRAATLGAELSSLVKTTQKTLGRFRV